MNRLFLLFLTLSIPFVSNAAKIPRWKMNAPQTSSSGIVYTLIKPGKGELPADSNRAVIDYVRYENSPKQITESSLKQYRGGYMLELNEKQIDAGFRNAVKLLRKGGKGFFSWRNPKGDSVHYYIRLRNILPPMDNAGFYITNPPDSIPVRFEDPEKNNHGDSLIVIATLAELPALMPGCDSAHKEMYVMLKISERYFDKGTRYREMLIAVPCVNAYGKDFFVPGKQYIITAIPWHTGDEVFREVADGYAANTELKRYRCLRIRKI
ncbi:MAG: hypothetical protein ACRC3B_19135 [Bacteroidia bacterium]